jgi:ATP-dependent DNA helicase DinG
VSQARELLGPDGPLASRLPGYEARDGQLQMAAAVEHALRYDEILLCEAGTGTGKTLAYLVPAILSGKKVVVSTATRALQEQIVTTDIPLIERMLNLKVDYAVMKGLSNYVCRRRLGDLETRSLASGKPRRGLAQISNFASASQSGDVAELTTLPETDSIWSEVTASADTRRGSQCSYYERCFVTKMRRRAEEARIVIVNHHLFFADLSLRGPHPGRVLPNYEAVVFDEAHQLEDIATDFFGVKVTSAKLERLSSDVERILSVLSTYDPSLGAHTANALVEPLRRASAEYFAAFAAISNGTDGRREIDPADLKGEPYDAWLRLDSALEAIKTLCTTTQARLPSLRQQKAERDLNSVSEELDIVLRRVDEQRQALATIEENQAKRVIWVELTDRVKSVTSAPFDLSNLLRARVFEAVPSVILTSATLTTSAASLLDEKNGSFKFLRDRLGLYELPCPVVELSVPSPFDFESRAVLYTPKDLPQPNDATFVSVAADRIEELIRLTHGGAFVLTTSIRSMHQLYGELKGRLKEHPVWIQGEAPKTELLQRFKAHAEAVLVATSSFWEGVDVPGRALRLVVLEKVPFFVPTDPLVRARSLALEAEGKNPFLDYIVPAAAITLKQGFGRLIRNRTDAGIVALLDGRLHRRGYGQRLLRSLPPAKRTHELAAVRRFWERLEREFESSRQQ